MAVCLGTFLAIYIIFLRKTTFFRFNRWFLMLGFTASIIVPTIKYTYDIVISVPLINIMDMAGAESVIVDHKGLDMWQILFMLYLLGLMFFVIRNIYAYIKLSGLIKEGTEINNRGFRLIENASVKSPFTFLNYIVLNTDRLNETERDLILKHEITHINQKHWIDLLCSECMLLLQWFNPLVWIYVRLLKENHEYLADKAVIDSGISPALYQAVLINQEFQGPVFSFSNSFNYSKPLNRLSMIKKAKSASWKRIAALLIVPVFGLFIWASAEPRYIMEYSMESVVSDTTPPIINYNIKISDKENTPGEEVVVVNKKGDRTVTRVGTILKGGEIAWNDSLKGKPKIFTRGISSDKKPLMILDGVEISDIENISPESIESFSVLKDKSAIDGYGDKGKNGVVIVETKKGTQNNVKTTSKLAVVHTKDSINNFHYFFRKDVSSFSNDKAPLILVDGEKIADINTLDVNTIESLSIFKDKPAIEKYGDEGKNGVILVTTKSKKD